MKKTPPFLALGLLGLCFLLGGCGDKPEENPNVVTNDPNASKLVKPHGGMAGGAATGAPAKPRTN